MSFLPIQIIAGLLLCVASAECVVAQSSTLRSIPSFSEDTTFRVSIEHEDIAARVRDQTIFGEWRVDDGTRRSQTGTTLE